MTTTWNPADHAAGFALSGGNLTATNTTTTTTFNGGRATDSKASGKWYFEATVVGNSAVFGSNGAVAVGLAASGFGLTINPGTSGNCFAYFPWSGLVEISGSVSTIQADTTNGHVMQIAIDLGGTLVWWKMDTGNWNNNGAANPATGANGKSFSTLAGPWFPYAGEAQGGTITANFGDSAFFGTVPSGFTAWGASAGAASLAGAFFGL